MADTPEACYVPTGEIGEHGGELFDSTRLSAASWYEDGQHGGVIAALMARSVDRRPTLAEMEVARVTIELFRVVPVARLEILSETVREGKKIQTSSVSAFVGATEVARGLVQKLRTTELELDLTAPQPPVLPDQLDRIGFDQVIPFPDDGRLSFGSSAVEVAHASGSYREPGAAVVWFRIYKQLVEGETVSPLERAVMSGDFLNGMTRLADPSEVVFMNTDLTIQLARHPEGEWVALDGESIWDSGGRGSAAASMFDVRGAFGSAGQTLFLDKASGSASGSR